MPTPDEDSLERTRAAHGGYIHAEAFCLMDYRSADGREIEYIWNARDGVTPFVVRFRRGTELTHVNWQRDRRIVDVIPQPGSRMFVDLTEQRAREIAMQRVAPFWDHPDYPMRERFETREAAIDALTQDLYRPGEPDIVVVE